MKNDQKDFRFDIRLPEEFEEDDDNEVESNDKHVNEDEELQQIFVTLKKTTQPTSLRDKRKLKKISPRTVDNGRVG